MTLLQVLDPSTTACEAHNIYNVSMPVSRSLWDDITEVYDQARAAGAAYKTDTNTELLLDREYKVEFILRVAVALRDKPKPPKERQVRMLQRGTLPKQ
jgi:hypothetical protein